MSHRRAAERDQQGRKTIAHAGGSEQNRNCEEAVGGNPIDDQTIHF
jgi:hypothetical protein